MNSATLYYIHDPMCSWCWGFNQTWSEVRTKIETQLNIQYVLGGLAPDTNQIMPVEMRRYIQDNWHKIEQEIPGTSFNYNFWKNCTPMRSTYPACRAVIAAKNQADKFELPMINIIQKAYYLQEKNPSKDETLIKLSISIGLDERRFIKDLNSDATQTKLDDDIKLYKSLGAKGFPSLVLENNGTKKLITIDYNNPEFILKQIFA